MIIAIDGPAASGKSTVARALACSIGAYYLDTGAMYRAIALAALRRGIPLSDERALGRLARDVHIDFVHAPDGGVPVGVLLDGDDVTSAIRTPDVDDAVSAVASMPEVRIAMVSQQRAVAHTADLLVVEGRDIGTFVFPDAEVKVFLTATPEERARRRHAEMGDRGLEVVSDAVLAGIERRDNADSSRKSAPLAAAPDAHVLDTTGLSIEQVIEMIASLTRNEI